MLAPLPRAYGVLHFACAEVCALEDFISHGVVRLIAKWRLLIYVWNILCPLDREDYKSPPRCFLDFASRLLYCTVEWNEQHASFQVIMTVLVKIHIFLCIMTPCRLVNSCWRFRRPCCLHLHCLCLYFFPCLPGIRIASSWCQIMLPSPILQVFLVCIS